MSSVRASGSFKPMHCMVALARLPGLSFLDCRNFLGADGQDTLVLALWEKKFEQ